ncbi:N-acetylmuramic acid 6-phosphate phosphatase [Vibrio stylophorae]|uniref:N-acetylmuramic acid 6-phosphate phosphatase n=1 Tax=Vibrio stylophorae TaxID=659351 RepID=A0ABM8ZRU3_9VIBR|nr:HAD-IA family hydrolase [Vibrio stylophorae]CAH0533018.1 N-acetylmuramic acid 6-phosphate phosphatase [Vibrio stylophorae]
MPRAVFFDLDGTLLDTAPDMALAANLVLADYDLPPLSEQHIQANTSLGPHGLLGAGFATLPPAKLQALSETIIREQFLRYYSQNLCVGTQLYQGVVELLEQLNQANICWGIVTNKPRDLTEPLLAQFLPLTQHHILVCADDLPRAKPHPDQLNHVCQQLALNPADCFYVGDIQNDIIAAKGAGMAPIVAGWGYTDGALNDAQHWHQAQVANSPAQVWHYLSQD